MALIETLLEFNQHVTVASDFDDERFLKYTKRVERNLIRIIGQTKYDEVDAMDDDEEAKILLQDYVANQALSSALSSFALNITNYGIFTNQVDAGEKADWRDKKDLNRNLLKFAFDALDAALAVIGITGTNLEGLFVQNLAQFERAYSLQGSYQTFLSLVPFMREVQDQFLTPVLGDCANYAFTDEQLNLIRAGIVNLTVSKAAVSGSFLLESNAVLLRIEVLPWEKVEKIEQQSLERFRADRFNVGMGYLNQVQDLIKTLPCYVEKEFVSMIEKRPSGLYL